MTFLDLLLVGVGLSMDAFAVAIAKGLGMHRVNWRHALVIALFFGGFQALMPALGWAVGALFASYVEAVDHWVAFILLAFIGGKMLWDAFHEDEAGESGEGAGADAPAGMPGGADVPAASGGGGRGVPVKDKPLDMRELLMLAIATSIDALAVGVSFAFLEVDIAPAVSLIGCTTFAISLAGVAIGNFFGSRWEKPATIAGGLVLITIGARILLEGLGVLG